jgi:adenylylsulfate kinase
VRVPTLFLTGTVGSGKTTIAIEIGEILEENGQPVTIVDLDWLAWVHPSPGLALLDALIVRNLAAIWPNLIAAGATSLVLVRATPDAALPDAVCAALPDADVTVVRLTAPAGLIEERLRQRDSGPELEQHLDEHIAMTAAMDDSGVGDLFVTNDRPVRQVAVEVLRLSGWLDPARP